MKVFRKHGYLNMSQVAKAALKRGLVEANERSLKSFYSQINTGTRSIPNKHVIVFMELCESDPEMKSAIANLGMQKAASHLYQTLDAFYYTYRQRFLESDYSEKLEMLGGFFEFTKEGDSRKRLENQVE